jgi:hypothetical protein
MQENEITGIEPGTPGLQGQGDGPFLDKDGIVSGMQYGTNHLHLGFGMKNFGYKTNGRIIKVTNRPFIHVGHWVHVDIIKNFLGENNIKFYEE